MEMPTEPEQVEICGTKAACASRTAIPDGTGKCRSRAEDERYVAGCASYVGARRCGACGCMLGARADGGGGGWGERRATRRARV